MHRVHEHLRGSLLFAGRVVSPGERPGLLPELDAAAVRRRACGPAQRLVRPRRLDLALAGALAREVDDRRRPRAERRLRAALVPARGRRPALEVAGLAPVGAP